MDTKYIPNQYHFEWKVPEPVFTSYELEEVLNSLEQGGWEVYKIQYVSAQYSDRDPGASLGPEAWYVIARKAVTNAVPTVS